MTMEALKLFLKNNIAWRISLVVLFLNFVFLIISWRKLPPQVPLFYSLPWGEEQLAHPGFLLILPLGCLVLGLFNLFLTVFFFKERPLARKILSGSTVILIFLASLALVKIIFLII